MNPAATARALPLSDRAASTLVDATTPAKAHLISLGELPDAAQGAGPPVVTEAAHPLHLVKVALQVCVGEVDLTIAELLAAREHQVFVLDQAVDRPIDLLLDGRVVARGQLIAVDDRFAVRITELPIPLRP